MERKATCFVAVAVCMIALAGCDSSKPSAAPTSAGPPKIAVLLPEKYNTPDGMVLAPSGDIYLNIPNFSDSNYPAKILKIDKKDNISEVFTLPAHPDTGKCGPLGIEIGPEGNLYVADNQSMYGHNDYKSRLLRVNIKDGKAVGCDVLVTGFIQSNAVSYHDGHVSVPDTSLDLEADPMPSGVYRFALSEFKRIGRSGQTEWDSIRTAISTCATSEKQACCATNSMPRASQARPKSSPKGRE
ncbi:MAG: hypothetical protein ACYS8Z_18810 [Planctomycetota bacterium]|jgi:hypothetical protein